MLQLGLTVAEADGVVEPEELRHLAERIDALFQLPPHELRRLDALRAVLLSTGADLAAITKRLEASMSKEAHLSVGRLLVAIAAADGGIERKEMTALRRCFRALSLPPESLDAVIAELVPVADTGMVVEAATIQAGWGDSRSARDCYKRAAELLEWLARSESDTAPAVAAPVPIPLLASACYQLADLPAMAAVMMTQAGDGPPLARLIGALLQSKFDSVLKHVTVFWSQHRRLCGPKGSVIDDERGEQLDDMFVLAELVRCIGAFAQSLALDDRARCDLSLRKLRGLSAFAARTADSFTWMLCELLAEVMATFVPASVYRGLDGLAQSLSPEGVTAARGFASHLFASGRGLLWKTQRLGLAKLAELRSVAICTPTGSGKTTIAEFAAVQALLGQRDAGTEIDLFGPLAIYLVPSRALATEVEQRLAADLQSLGSGVVVTGLYGGTEWGVADAWLTASQPTILVATIEKTDALMRFVGPLLYHRLKLVVLDEAHHVDLGRDRDAVAQALVGDSRQARLEQVIARLLANSPRARCVALSAVAHAGRRALARWISEGREDEPITSDHRSIRQVVGRLECNPGRAQRMIIEGVDGGRLDLQDSTIEPYVPLPFPVMPQVPPDHRNTLRGYHQISCLWAAAHLAHAGRSVLISVMERIDTVTKRFAEMLAEDDEWTTSLPQFFTPPIDGAKAVLYQACLQACRDYCGPTAFETVLLERGIAVHHGQLPVRVRRLMTDVIRKGVVQIVTATSTLTEGVNLPFDVILVPSILRTISTEDGPISAPMSVSEFRNLAGRAGRPGSKNEGLTLVTTSTVPTSTAPATKKKQQDTEIPRAIERLQKFFADLVADKVPEPEAHSGLAALVVEIGAAYLQLRPNATDAELEEWLERCSPVASMIDERPSEGGMFDTLDQYVLGLVVEAETLLQADAPWAAIEERLQLAWSHTYAKYADEQNAWLETVLAKRAKYLHDTIYPDRAERLKLYRAGLPPQRAKLFAERSGAIEAHLKTGGGYGRWNKTQQFEFVLRTAMLIDDSRTFRLSSQRVDWQVLLRWWLNLPGAEGPEPADLKVWQKAVADKFEYRLTSAITATIGLAMARIAGDLRAPGLRASPRHSPTAAWPQCA